MNEDLAKALDSSKLAVTDLQSALKVASPVEALLLLPMIEDAVKLSIKIDNLLAARAAQRTA